MTQIASKFVEVDGIRSHYLEAGDGPTVVLLHSGEFGACAEISWEFTVPALASSGYRAIAPDWLGFGGTDKLFDFGGQRQRVFRHMQRFCEVMGIEAADFIGNSMGGSNLVRIASERPLILPIRSMVLASGGGFAPENDDRKKLLAYDGTPEAMKGILSALFYDPKWPAEEEYVAKRQEHALKPGAWECIAAARFKSPMAQGKSQFGQPDTTEYENVAVPTLMVVGASDKLREPGYADEIARRIPDCQLVMLENCGHCPAIERPADTNRAIVAFLDRVHGRT